MSRIGKQIIDIPGGVTVRQEADRLTVEGPKGQLNREFLPLVEFTIGQQEATCRIKADTARHRALWGTYASHLKNMITGVTEGYSKKLIIEGIGYKASLKDDQLILDLGFSHPVTVEIPRDLTVTVEKNQITVTGIDKEKVGQLAARIRSHKKTEPYKGKGIRYDNEVVLRKQGKKTAS